MTLTCVIEFGSSRINAVAAERGEDYNITIRAVESVFSNSSIRHGHIHNIEEIAAKVKGLIQKLNNRLSTTQDFRSIGKAYVSIGGMSTHTISHNPLAHLGQEGIVTAEAILQLRKQSLELSLQGYDILSVVPMYYELDGKAYYDATGGHGSELIGHHQIIVARNKLREGINRVMQRAGLEIAGYITQPLSAARILTTEEKQKGCLLLNWGAETTTVIIYKGNMLRHIAVIPLGGETVTKDIMSQGVRHDVAEDAKIKWSTASPNSHSDIRPNAIEQNAIGMEIGLLNAIVQSRYEEIILNVRHQIECAGLEEMQLEAGCVITGDAANQKGLNTLIGKQLGMNVSVRAYCHHLAGGAEKKLRYASILSMIEDCIIDCQREKRKETIPTSASIQEKDETQKQETTPSEIRDTTTQTIGRQQAEEEIGHTTRKQIDNKENPSQSKQNGRNKNEDYHLPSSKKNKFQRFIGDLFSGLDD